MRLDMSEFMERHTVSKLIGSPPGVRSPPWHALACLLETAGHTKIDGSSEHAVHSSSPQSGPPCFLQAGRPRTWSPSPGVGMPQCCSCLSVAVT